MEKLAILIASLTFFAGCASTSSTGTASTASPADSGSTYVGASATSVSGTGATPANGQTTGVYNSAANPASSPEAIINSAAGAPATSSAVTGSGTVGASNPRTTSSPSGQQGVISGENATPKLNGSIVTSGATIHNMQSSSSNFGASTNQLRSGTYSQDSTNPGAAPNTSTNNPAKTAGSSGSVTPQ